jgi:hypothetical protein
VNIFLTHLFSRCLLPLLLHVLIPQPLPHEVVGKPSNGMVLLVPVSDFVDGPVRAAVVRRAVVADPVSHGLDENWPALSDGNLPGLFGGVVDGKNVVAVHSDGRHAVGGTADGDAITPVLLMNGSGDCVAIVSAEMIFANKLDGMR